MPSVELRMQLHQRKLTTRLSVAGGNIGDDRVNNFCSGVPAKSKIRIGRKYLIYIMQAHSI
jgi:hypothetical protein